jgi:acid-sensing ion channel, other
MPGECPQFSSKFFYITPSFSVTYILKPKMMVASSKLQGYPVSLRNCYFSNERRLKYFNHYTQANCETECMADLVLEKCGCIQIFYNG